MKRSTYLWSILALTVLQLPAAHDARREASAFAKPQAVKAYGQLPLSFEANQGQTDQRVKFLSHGSGYSLFLTGDEAVLALKKPGGSTARDQLRKLAVPSAGPPAVVRMKLVGANASAKVTGLAELPGKSNYFIGSDPKKWRTNVPNYAKVKYSSVYPGVDLVYYGNHRQLEYDFVVQPGADPKAIRLEFAGDLTGEQATTLRIDGNGDLVVGTVGGEVIFHRPVVYQPANHSQGTRDVLDGKYVIRGDKQVTFEVARYDKTKPLVIDPTLYYSTYLGGSDFAQGSGIAVDASGNAYVTGFTLSTDFPTTHGFGKTFFPGNVFVSKLNADGSGLVYSAILGSSYPYGAPGFGPSIAIDTSGNAYVTGVVDLFGAVPGFPITPGAFQTTFGGGPRDAFVTKLNTTGSALLYSTFLGGSGDDAGNGIAVDASGSAYVTGTTYSPSSSNNFPITPGAFQTTFGGYTDGFVSKLNAAGSVLVYSTFLGGSGGEEGHGIAVDASGSAYVTGYTYSSNFPVTPGAFQTAFGGVSDAFVSKLNGAGSALLYSTYLGGSDDDRAYGIAADAAGNAYVTGGTSSSNFPTTPGAFQTAPGVSSDAFVAKVNGAGSALLYSTYLGGSGGATGYGIAADAAGNAYVAGGTGSNFPITPGAFQTTFGGGTDAFATKLNTIGSALLYSTYLGGSGDESNEGMQGLGMAVDASGNAYVTGGTSSPNFPITPGAFQTTFSSINFDGFVSKFSFSSITLSPSNHLDFGAQLINTASSKTVTLTNDGDATLAISSIGITGPSGSFSETNNCGSSLLAGASCSIAVTFRPTSTGTCAETGYLTVTDKASGGVGTVKLSGAGSVMTVSVKSLNFGNQAVGTTSSAKTITMTNHATSGVVSIAAISITGFNSRAFAQTNTCGTSLAAGASCTVSVTFTPHSIGSKTATLNVWNNGGAAALKASLTGNGT